MIESRVVHLDVEDRSEELLAPALLCHKEPARRIQSPLLGASARKIPLGGILLAPRWLWHKGAYNRTLPCMEATFPYATKNQ